MGFTLNGIHSDTIGAIFSTEAVSIVPSKKQTSVSVLGRDGSYIFEGSFENISIELSGAIPGYEIVDRRKIARKLSNFLSKTGSLVFDYEPDIEYNVVKITNNISANMQHLKYYDSFNVIFECEPTPIQTYYNDIEWAWEDISTAWAYMNFPWAGMYPRIFTVVSGSTINLVNTGTYKALPIIILRGKASNISFGGMTYINLDGTVYIDCKNQVVYSIDGTTKVNRLSNFSGEFIEISPEPDVNVFTVSGSITNLTIEFDYKNTFL